MKPRSAELLLFLEIFIEGCSNTRFLTKEQTLYTGRENVEINYPHNISNTFPVKKYVKSTTFHKVNNSLFGRRVLPPVGLWVHNHIKVNEKKKFGKWFYKTFSSNPILITDVNPEL